MTVRAPRPAEQSEIVFLGLCDRANYVRDGNTNIFSWNILGLRNVVLSHIFPIGLNGYSVGFALRSSREGLEAKFRVRDEFDNEIGTINLSSKLASPDHETAVLKTDRPLVCVSEHGWAIAFFSLLELGWIISAPGVYYLEHLTDVEWVKIGTLHFAVVDSPPLTVDRITAIKSEPNAAKAVRIELGCKHCASRCRTYAALEKNDKLEEEGWVWYQCLPERFSCAGTKTIIDLQYIRRNLHGVLGRRWRVSDQIDFVPLYHKSALQSALNNFGRLINQTPSEEVLQQFIGENPILLHQFPSVRIMMKPKILTSYVADFGIVTPTKELLLLELEKTNTRLMKKDGGIAAPLSHAFDQVRYWLHEIDEHRLAVLDSLDIDRDEVGIVRGVVIAGRDAGYDAKNLRKLKGADWGRVTFRTYDDLLFALDALIRRVEEL